METCHMSPLPLLSTHPAERGEEGPRQWDRAGGRDHMLPSRSDPALRSPAPRPLCQQCRWGWKPGLGAPCLLQSDAT